MSGTRWRRRTWLARAAILFQQHCPGTGAQGRRRPRAPPAGSAHLRGGRGSSDPPPPRRRAVTATGSAYLASSWRLPRTWRRCSARSPPQQALEPRHPDLSENAGQITGGAYDVDPGADNGTPAPEGMFTLSTDCVTVPADGTATVTATAKPLESARAATPARRCRSRRRDAVVRAHAERVLHGHALRAPGGDYEPADAEARRARHPLLPPVGESGDLTPRLLPGTPAASRPTLHHLAANGCDSVAARRSAPGDHRRPRIDGVARREQGRRGGVRACLPRTRVLFLDWYRSDGCRTPTVRSAG